MSAHLPPQWLHSAFPGRAAASAQPTTPLPPSIAALSDLCRHAEPFTDAERLVRIDRAQRLMSETKLDAIVLANSTKSSVYFADLPLDERRASLGSRDPRQSQAVFLVCPAFEEGRTRQLLLEAEPFRKAADVLTWQEGESPLLSWQWDGPSQPEAQQELLASTRT